MQKKILLILVFAFIIAFFSIQNASPVLVRFFNWEEQISLAFIVLGAFAFGALIMYLVSSFKQLKMGKEIKTLKKEKEKLLARIEEMEKTTGELQTRLHQYKPGPGSEEKIEELEKNNLDVDKDN